MSGVDGDCQKCCGDWVVVVAKSRRVGALVLIDVRGVMSKGDDGDDVVLLDVVVLGGLVRGDGVYNGMLELV